MTDNEIMQEIELHVSAISSLLGIPVTESNADTPRRVAKMYCSELFQNRNYKNFEQFKESMTLFPARGYHDPVCVDDIHFWSTCEHHWLPFGGTCDVTYIPKDRIIGLSKIPRVVRYFSRMPQLQENMTKQIAEFLFDLLKPEYIQVRIRAKHTCVMCRGAENDCETTTTCELGEYP